MAEKFDRIIHNGLIVTVNPQFDVIADGLVGISNGIIQMVAQRKQKLCHLMTYFYFNLTQSNQSGNYFERSSILRIGNLAFSIIAASSSISGISNFNAR